jgi:hypothetical protein
MPDVIADLAENINQTKDKARQSTCENTALDRRYGKIGISAVTAAARYQGTAKNPAYAPAAAGRYDDTGEAA